MYKLIGKVLNGSSTVGYDVVDTNTGNKKYMTVEQVQGLAIAGALENVKFNGSTNTIHGINGNDLRKLSRRQQTVGSIQLGSSGIFTGSKLRDIVNTTIDNYKPRILVKALMKFITEPTSGKVCALYGLRRTGKTTMMMHSIKMMQSNGVNNIAYITLTERSQLANLYKSIQQLTEKGIQYIFIDEITAVSGFIQTSATLADCYAKQGIHIVISGTDSYILKIAWRSGLYDRVVKINTTYIGYSEYARLNGGASIIDYIHDGGVLTADTFYNNSNTMEYIDTAISDNIINSLLRANNRREYGHIMELDSRGLLKKAIEQAISASNEELTAYVITDVYHNRDLGSAKQIMESIFDIDSKLDTEEVEEIVRYKLSIVKEFDAQISDEYIDELKEFLVDIGVLKEYTRYIGSRKHKVSIFVQPGLRYNQTVELIKALYETPSFYDITRSVRKQFMDKIIQGVEGSLLEHEVLLHYLNRVKQNSKSAKQSDGIYSNDIVTQFNYKGKEIDVIVGSKGKLKLIEVKRSSKIVKEQNRWLVDNEFNRYIADLFNGEIVDRIVLYLGNDEDIIVNDTNVHYRNISNYLRNN